MWLLDCEGDTLEGKRIWLRPGERYLFGRTVAELGQFAITGLHANTVSRKHLTIDVDSVTPGDGQRLRSRSRVTITNLATRTKTKVNGVRVENKYTLPTTDTGETEGNGWEVQMGSFPGKFHIRWHPIVLSFSIGAKDIDEATCHALEALDIKYLSSYEANTTTHVIAKTRNTSKGLQALIRGVALVNRSFVDAVLAVAHAEQIDEGVSRSMLEADFNGYWPDALQYVPTSNREPVKRPAEAFAPDVRRKDMFEGYTFIFYSEEQFQSLLGPITTGKGKALCKSVVPEVTLIDEFIGYVKSVAGEKGLGEFEDGSEGKGVVVVKYLPKPNSKSVGTGNGNGNESEQAWFADFYTNVSLRLDHRLVDQKDFLDAILGGDASVLRRPLEADTRQQSQQQQQIPQTQQQERTITAKTNRRRPAAPLKNRFKGFLVSDDEVSDDNNSDGPAAKVIPDVVSTPAQTQQAAMSQDSGLFVSQDPNITDTAPHPSIPEAQSPISRKRPAPPISSTNSMDEFFAPTAAHVKRRRIEAGEDPVPPPRQPSPPPPDTTTATAPKSPEIKMDKDGMDVLALARQNLAAAEARARAERDELATLPEDLDLAEIRRLHIVEEIELRVPPQAQRERDLTGDRWDPQWNGRRNFKKFRQRGAAVAARPPQRILVPLEEAKTKGFGIGDDYWLEDEASRKGKSQSKGQNKSQWGSSSTTRAVGRGRHREAITGVEDEEEEVEMQMDEMNNEEEDDEDEDGDINIISSARGRGTSQRQQQRGEQDGNQPSVNTRDTQASRSTTTSVTHSQNNRGKRPAAPAEPPPSKRPRRGLPVEEGSDSEEEELRFRFRR